MKQDTGTQHAYLCNYISDKLCNIIEHASLTIKSLEPIAMHITEHLVFKQWIKKNHYNVLHNLCCTLIRRLLCYVINISCFENEIKSLTMKSV